MMGNLFHRLYWGQPNRIHISPVIGHYLILLFPTKRYSSRPGQHESLGSGPAGTINIKIIRPFNEATLEPGHVGRQ